MLHYVYGGEGTISSNPESGSLKVCPSFKDNTLIRMALTSPNNSSKLISIYEEHGGIDPDYIKPLAETTDLSMLDFYEIINAQDGSNCFESPGEYWH